MRTLFIDIETSPNLVYTFGLRNQFIGPEQIVKPTRLLCFAAQWYGEDDTQFYSEWNDGRIGMLEQAHALLEQADAVIHYNGEKFDERRLNQEFAAEGWDPPAPYQRIDLWRTINRRFDLPSQKLTYALRHFGLDDKLSTGGIGLWMDVLQERSEACAKMEEYNRNDVAIMVPLYEALLPWIPGHPNKVLYDGTGLAPECPVCGSSKVQKRGFARTQVASYQRYKCMDCGSWSREGRRQWGTDLRQVAS